MTEQDWDAVWLALKLIDETGAVQWIARDVLWANVKHAVSSDNRFHESPIGQIIAQLVEPTRANYQSIRDAALRATKEPLT